MKAVVIHAARDLRVEEREAETPGPGQVEVAIEAGGICGSDLHYFNHGGFGTVRVREPMIPRPRDRRHDQGDRPGRVEIQPRRPSGDFPEPAPQSV
jgi:hypothetical protein